MDLNKPLLPKENYQGPVILIELPIISKEIDDKTQLNKEELQKEKGKNSDIQIPLEDQLLIEDK